ncbi:hypothetical protein D1007_03829 [Hordeum vulgare]|nr:hypothetical protein D1007_03829 [Hordeum vulgare]
MSAAANSTTSPLPTAPDVEVDAEPDEEVPRHDDEDEIIFPEQVHRVSQETVEDEYAQEPSSRARFDDTDDEEREENIDSLVLQEYVGEDMPRIEWNRENPDLTPRTVFEPMVDCHNAVTTYCILTEYSYEVDRSDPGRFTFHCPYDRCRWRLHASTMQKSKLIQIKSNPHRHTFPPGGGGGKDKSKLAKTRPYLAIDATSLNGRWRGQLAAASVVDGNNWIFPVAFGVLEVESEERWVWFLQQLHNIIDYVTNNLDECFNAKFKSVKGLLLWQTFDKIRQMIMVKMALRKRIAETQYVGHLMLPSLIKALHAKARELGMKCIRPWTYEAEVTYTDNKNREWRYPVNLATNECIYRQWQIYGKPCINALHLMTIIGGEDGEVDQYCSEYFSVAKFRRCNNPVDASFGEEEQWTAKNAEEHAAVEENAPSLEDNAATEENAASLENEATEVAIREEEVILSIREKRPREEESSVEPSPDAEFESMAYEGFEAIREEEVILFEVPLKISEPTYDRQLFITSSISQSSTKPPPPEVKIRSNKTKLSKAQNIPARETRSKTVNPSRNTRSKAKI